MRLAIIGSNNTNKLSPQEPQKAGQAESNRSNNTNKLSPQELPAIIPQIKYGSNNTNKLSPQEQFQPLMYQ